MVSDAVLLALIATITPTVTAIGALIIALRTKKTYEVDKARKEGADAGRARRQRKTDKAEPAPREPGAAP